VATADRVLAVLSAFRRGDAALGLGELAERTGLVKSTILRLVVSLERQGFLIRLHDGTYQLDAEVLRLGGVYQASFNLENHVLPVLKRLADESEESAAFYIRHHNSRLCLYRVDSPHRLRLHIRPGDMLPMDNSSVAQVLREYGGRSRAQCGNGLDVPVFTSGVRDPHTASLSMPVFGGNSQLAGVLALTGPVTRLTADRAKVLSPKLHVEGTGLTRALGGVPRDA
jgi:DNA-binding IclR family transcriptional regulator